MSQTPAPGFALFQAEHAALGTGTLTAWRALLSDERRAYNMKACAIELKERELHQGKMLKLAVVYLYHLSYLVGYNNFQRHGTKLCYEEDSIDPTEWEQAMTAQNISFTTYNKKYMYLVRTFFKGLWDRDFQFNVDFVDLLYDKRGINEQITYEQATAYVMQPWTYPTSNGRRYAVRALLERLAELSKDDYQQWKTPRDVNAHPYRTTVYRRNYTIGDLAAWVHHDLRELEKKYPELVDKKEDKEEYSVSDSDSDSD